MNELLAHIQTKNTATLAWVNEDPQNRWATTLLEDINYWNGQGIYTVAQFERFQLENTIWDLYKDVHGIRPRWLNFAAMSDMDLKSYLDSLIVDLDEANEHAAIEQAQAIEAFEALVSETIALGAGNRETALRWLKQADEFHSDDEYFCYAHNLPFNYFKGVA